MRHVLLSFSDTNYLGLGILFKLYRYAAHYYKPHTIDRDARRVNNNYYNNL